MGVPISEISNQLNRHRSTIYREIARNKEMERYFPVVAQRKAKERKNRNAPAKLIVM
jgi:transposase, IS30 family